MPISEDLILGAEAFLAAKQALAAGLPVGFVSDPAVFLIFELYVAAGRWTLPSDVEIADKYGLTPAVLIRWARALEAEGLVARQAGRHVLSAKGIETATATLIAMDTARRNVRRDARANGSSAAAS